MTSEPNRDDPQDPGFARVRDYLLFGLSLPERTLRCASGLVGGTLRESAALLVPQAFQNSKTYSVMVRQMLDFLAEDVGGVKRKEGSETQQVEDFVARKAVGNFIDMAGMATLHLSPMMLLAIVSDVAYGSQAYLRELAADLKRQGVIDEGSTIEHVDDLLDAVACAARTTSGAFDTPPLSVEGLKQTIDETRAAVTRIDPTSVIPQAEVQRLWDDIHGIAAKEGVNPLAVSGAMTLYTLDKLGAAGRGALSTVTVASELFNRHVIDHYQHALGEIRCRGFYATLAETSGPYLEAVWLNFSTDKATITEDLLTGRLFGKAWTSVSRWFGGSAN